MKTSEIDSVEDKIKDFSDLLSQINDVSDKKKKLWKEIYQNAAGLGKAGNCIGGFTFMFSDGWWKYKQTENLDVHDTHASWVNGGYQNDYVPGENNMNEEWYGICAKGKTDERGHYQLYPRAAYYALQQVHKLNPYANNVTADSINAYFSNIQVTKEVLKSKGN